MALCSTHPIVKGLILAAVLGLNGCGCVEKKPAFGMKELVAMPTEQLFNLSVKKNDNCHK